MFEKLTGWLSSTAFYQDHVINWEPPFDDPSFDVMFLFFLLLILLVPEVFDLARLFIRRAGKNRAENVPAMAPEAAAAGAAASSDREAAEINAEPKDRILPVTETPQAEVTETPQAEVTEALEEAERIDAVAPEDETERDADASSPDSPKAPEQEEEKTPAALSDEDDYTKLLREIRGIQKEREESEAKEREKEERFRENADRSSRELRSLFLAGEEAV